MPPTTPGSDRPSTLGGRGWLPRTAGHGEEMAAGGIWSPCGYTSEVDPLRRVLLARPPDTLHALERPDDHLMTAPIDLGAIRAQADAVEGAYRRHGVDVQVLDAPSAPPNLIFLRDLLLMTPHGAVLARMASRQRAGEERYAAAALAAAGYPLLRTVAGRATFEGADALWVDRSTVAVGVGFRTNPAGVDVVREILREQGAEVVAVPLGPGVQHLLGAVTFLDERLAAIHRHGATADLRALLRRHGYRLIEFEPDHELVTARGMNLVALGPGRVLMPAGSPGIRRHLETAGVEVDEVDIGEYLKAAGGLGCVTAIVHREA